MVNLCQKNDKFPTPTFCNAHRDDRRCVCRVEQNQTFKKQQKILCRQLFGFQKPFKFWFSIFSTIVYDKNFDSSDDGLDAMILQDLENIMNLESGSLVILSKFCKNEKFHVQIGQLKFANQSFPFKKEDFLLNHWKLFAFSEKNFTMKNAVLASSKMQIDLPLFPLFVPRSNFNESVVFYEVNWR